MYIIHVTATGDQKAYRKSRRTVCAWQLGEESVVGSSQNMKKLREMKTKKQKKNMKQETCLSFFGVDIVHFVKFLNDFFSV